MEIKSLHARLRAKLQRKLAILLQVLECDVPRAHHESALPASLKEAYPWRGGKLRHYVERVSHELAEGGQVSKTLISDVESLILRPPKFAASESEEPFWMKRLRQHLFRVSEARGSIDDGLACAVDNLFLALRGRHRSAFAHSTQNNAAILAQIKFPDTLYMRRAAMRVSKNFIKLSNYDSDD